MKISESLKKAYSEARTRFTNQFSSIQEGNLTKKLEGTPNSAGFLIRHIGDVELLFAKNVFGTKDLQVHAKTVIDQKDSGNWINLEELKSYLATSEQTLLKIIDEQSDSDWENTITTNEFGTKTKAEAFGRIISHTAYHAGQLAMILKYGK
ncbi:MAG: hypothetical protein RL679_1880 [Bacteroidota bacterium]|jgi:uncharacterized damage-inducible protein DinB